MVFASRGLLLLLLVVALRPGTVPATSNGFSLLKKGTLPFSFTCGGSTAIVFVIAFSNPPSSSSYQALLCVAGSMSSLVPSNFTNTINEKNATSIGILVKVGNACPASTYFVRLFVVYPEANERFIIDNSLEINSTSSLAFIMPRATISVNPLVYPFVNSVVTSAAAKFSVVGSLVNTTHVELGANIFVSCTKVFVSYLVIESTSNDSLSWSVGNIVMNGTAVNYPIYDSVYWTDYLIGLTMYNVVSDGNWSCSTGPLTCSGLRNTTILTVVFFTNITCTANSVYNPVVFGVLPTCTCNDGYWANVSVCSACHYSCLTCSSATQTDCITCNLNAFRESTGTQCPCISGYYDGGVSTCTLCTPSLYCLTCNGSTNCTSCNLLHFRQLSASSCICQAGYYNSGVSVCALCNYMCATCITGLSCTSCVAGNNRNTSDSVNCLCSNGYYDNGVLTCENCMGFCSTCTSGTQCSACLTGLHRNISDSTNCACLPGYYSDGSVTCAVCHYNCATCNNALTCTSCIVGGNRNISDAVNCPCSNGYYDTGTVSCSVCSALCLTCSSTASNCLTCDPQLNRAISGNTCVCMPGYYDNNSLSVCVACSLNCNTCVSQNNCTQCVSNYKLLEGMCNQDQMLLTLKFKRQAINVVLLEATLSSKAVFSDFIGNVLSLWSDNVSLPYKLVSVSTGLGPTVVFLTINITNNIRNLTIVFANGSVFTISGEPAKVDPCTITLSNLYVFNEMQCTFIEKCNNYLKRLIDVTNVGRAVSSAAGILFVFASFTQFVQLISNYVFIDMDLPPNLNSLFETLYNSLQVQIIPITMEPPLSDSEDFQRPGLFVLFDYSFNFIHRNFFCVMQIIGLIVYYYLLSLVTRIKSDGCLIKQVRNRFHQTFYANSIETYLSSHVGLAFGSIVVMLDRTLTSRFKIYNWVVICLFGFVVAELAFVHILILCLTKRKSSFNTRDCYSKTQRQHKLSELYIFTKILVSTTVVLTIPLCTAWLSLTLICLACVIHGICTLKCPFVALRYKVSRILYVVFHTSIQASLLLLYVGPRFMSISPSTGVLIGYVVMGLIVANVVLDVGYIVADVCLMVFYLLRSFHNQFQRRRKPNAVQVEGNTSVKMEIKRIRRILPGGKHVVKAEAIEQPAMNQQMENSGVPIQPVIHKADKNIRGGIRGIFQRRRLLQHKPRQIKPMLFEQK